MLQTRGGTDLQQMEPRRGPSASRREKRRGVLERTVQGGVGAVGSTHWRRGEGSAGRGHWQPRGLGARALEPRPPPPWG